MDRRDFTKRLSMWLPTILFSSSFAKTKKIDFERMTGNGARNVIFILSDDHRYDFMGFTGKIPWLKTPNMDRLAKHGIWDTNEFYDLEKDPHEMNNLIKSPEHQELIETLVNELYDWLGNTSGLKIPLKRPLTPRFGGDYRNTGLY